MEHPASFRTGIICVLSKEAIIVLYQRDAFNEDAVRETLWAMRFLLPGLPAFCCAKVAVTTHHGRKDTKTPVKVSMWCILLNLILNLSLFPFLRQGGLALATAVCSWINVLTLLAIDTRKLPNWNWRKTLLGAIRRRRNGPLAHAAAVQSRPFPALFDRSSCFRLRRRRRLSARLRNFPLPRTG